MCTLILFFLHDLYFFFFVIISQDFYYLIYIRWHENEGCHSHIRDPNYCWLIREKKMWIFFWDFNIFNEIFGGELTPLGMRQVGFWKDVLGRWGGFSKKWNNLIKNKRKKATGQRREKRWFLMNLGHTQGLP